MTIAICENKVWNLKPIEDMVNVFLEKRKIKGRLYRYQSETSFLKDAADVMYDIALIRELFLLNQDCIRYVEAEDKMMKIYTTTGEYHTWMSLGSLQEQLDWERFVKLQRSYLVHMEYITEIRGEYCTLKDGTRISISRKKRADIRVKYREYREQGQFRKDI